MKFMLFQKSLEKKLKSGEDGEVGKDTWQSSRVESSQTLFEKCVATALEQVGVEIWKCLHFDLGKIDMPSMMHDAGHMI